MELIVTVAIVDIIATAVAAVIDVNVMFDNIVYNHHFHWTRSHINHFATKIKIQKNTKLKKNRLTFNQ